MSKKPQPPRIRRPHSTQSKAPEKVKVPTLESMLTDIRKVFGMQLNTFVVQFLENHTDADIEAFLPEDLSEADQWIDGLIEQFTENEEPDTDDMMDGVAAIFMMAFLEKLYEACGVSSEDEDEDEDDSDE